MINLQDLILIIIIVIIILFLYYYVFNIENLEENNITYPSSINENNNINKNNNKIFNDLKDNNYTAIYIKIIKKNKVYPSEKLFPYELIHFIICKSNIENDTSSVNDILNRYNIIEYNKSNNNDIECYITILNEDITKYVNNNFISLYNLNIINNNDLLNTLYNDNKLLNDGNVALPKILYNIKQNDILYLNKNEMFINPEFILNENNYKSIKININYRDKKVNTSTSILFRKHNKKYDEYILNYIVKNIINHNNKFDNLSIIINMNDFSDSFYKLSNKDMNNFLNNKKIIDLNNYEKYNDIVKTNYGFSYEYNNIPI